MDNVGALDVTEADADEGGGTSSNVEEDTDDDMASIEPAASVNTEDSRSPNPLAASNNTSGVPEDDEAGSLGTRNELESPPLSPARTTPPRDSGFNGPSSPLSQSASGTAVDDEEDTGHADDESGTGAGDEPKAASVSGSEPEEFKADFESAFSNLNVEKSN